MTGRHDRGDANALGLVLIAPVAVALAILILWIGLKVDADAQVQEASSAAAQAAARQRSPVAAVAAAVDRALMLTDLRRVRRSTVSIDASQFRAGGGSPSWCLLAQRSDLACPIPTGDVHRLVDCLIDPYRAVALP
jgi:hypothetical protein